MDFYADIMKTFHIFLVTWKMLKMLNLFFFLRQGTKLYEQTNLNSIENISLCLQKRREVY